MSALDRQQQQLWHRRGALIPHRRGQLRPRSSDLCQDAWFGQVWHVRGHVRNCRTLQELSHLQLTLLMAHCKITNEFFQVGGARGTLRKSACLLT